MHKEFVNIAVLRSYSAAPTHVYTLAFDKKSSGGIADASATLPRYEPAPKRQFPVCPVTRAHDVGRGARNCCHMLVPGSQSFIRLLSFCVEKVCPWTQLSIWQRT